jgi:hypothetical protein
MRKDFSWCCPFGDCVGGVVRELPDIHAPASTVVGQLDAAFGKFCERLLAKRAEKHFHLLSHGVAPVIPQILHLRLISATDLGCRRFVISGRGGFAAALPPLAAVHVVADFR